MFYKLEGTRGSVDDPNVDSLESFRISPSQFPDEARGKFHAAHEELVALGFHSPVCYWIHDVQHQTDIYQAVYLHHSGQAMARIHYRVWRLPIPAQEYFFPLFVTRFIDGSYLVSTAGERDVAAPLACRENRRVAATATDLWNSHGATLQEEVLFKTVRPIHDEHDLLETVESHHAVVRDFHVDRGVFVPMTEDEERAVAEAAEAAAEGGSEGEEVPPQHSAILDEIERLQNKRSGWGGALIVLIVSIGLFLGLGAARWSMGFVAMLLPILFFHELGHYAAMRLFRYSNVKMFFIPLLGAAVSGRHYNVPGWKKVVVSLAGPLPGIFVATGLGICAAYFEIEWLRHAAMLTLILNGFNLLPILPLDGGWVMHALLFSRHYVLDAGFRVAAVAALLAGGLFDGFFLFFGIVMAMGLPVAFRMVGVVSALRRQGISAASPDDQSIPAETAETIADEIRRRLPQGLTDKNLAQFTLQAFEALNARPPGIFATIFLGGIYVGSFFFAIVALSVLVALPMLMGPNYTPTHPIEIEQIEAAGRDRGDDVPEDEVTIVATFSDSEEAAARFVEFQEELPADATLLRFGESLLVAVPPKGQVAPEEWESRFIFQSSELLNSANCFTIGLSVAATAPSEDVGAEIERALNDHFVGGIQELLTPPWHPDQPPTLEQRKARELYARLLRADWVYGDPRYDEISQQIDEAYEKDDYERAAELEQDLWETEALISKEHLQEMLDESDDPLERELIELHRQRPVFEFELDEPIDPNEPMPEEVQLAREKAANEFQEAYDTWRGRISEPLGALPSRDGEVVPGASRYSLDDGMVDRTGTTLEFTFFGMDRPVDGAPAFIRWLDEQGCTEIKYTFIGD